MTESIRVYPTDWVCVHPDWHNLEPGCPKADVHFHANCERCRYKPDTCEDCRKGGCIRCHTTERVWAATPDEVRAKIRAHWATDHEPADLLELLEGL